MPENVSRPQTGRVTNSKSTQRVPSHGSRSQQSLRQHVPRHPMRAPLLATFVVPPSEISTSPTFHVKADSISISPSSSSSCSLSSPLAHRELVADSPVSVPVQSVPLSQTPLRELHVPNEEELETPYDNPAIPRMRRSSCASLEHKARKILEREMMFEKLISVTRANLLDIEEQMNELGNRYMTVRRSTGSVPSRRRVEIPEMLPSPIREDFRGKEKENEDSFDEDFSRVLRSTPPLETERTPLTKPPMAPRYSVQEKPPLLSGRPLSQRN